jgi:zinc resistance-associated protein
MWKPAIVGAAALAIAGSSLVYAQQRDQGGARWRPSQEDRAAFTDARIAALKAGLRLTPDQEKNWPAFETALRDIAKMHGERGAAMQQNERRSDDPTVQLRRHAEMMTNVGESLKRLADTEEPLYQSLDDSQKNRFRLLSRVLTSHRPHFAQRQGRGGHGGRGMMRGEGDRDGGGRSAPHGMGDDRDHGNEMGEQGGQL